MPNPISNSLELHRNELSLYSNIESPCFLLRRHVDDARFSALIIHSGMSQRVVQRGRQSKRQHFFDTHNGDTRGFSPSRFFVGKQQLCATHTPFSTAAGFSTFDGWRRCDRRRERDFMKPQRQKLTKSKYEMKMNVFNLFFILQSFYVFTLTIWKIIIWIFWLLNTGQKFDAKMTQQRIVCFYKAIFIYNY